MTVRAGQNDETIWPGGVVVMTMAVVNMSTAPFALARSTDSEEKSEPVTVLGVVNVNLNSHSTGGKMSVNGLQDPIVITMGSWRPFTDILPPVLWEFRFTFTTPSTVTGSDFSSLSVLLAKANGAVLMLTTAIVMTTTPPGQIVSSFCPALTVIVQL